MPSPLLMMFTAVFAAAPLSAAAATTPFPDGYDAAYRAFIAALPTLGKQTPWLTKLNSVSSLPREMTVAGKPILYLFACKDQSCDTENVNIFLGIDRKTFGAVLTMSGTQTLIGGAGKVEVTCVREIDENSGVLDAC